MPAVCELLGIPVSGSDPLALAVALDKDMTRRIVEAAGLTVPKGFTIAPPPGVYDGDHAEFPPLLEANGLTCPVIVKPATATAWPSTGRNQTRWWRSPSAIWPTA